MQIFDSNFKIITPKNKMMPQMKKPRWCWYWTVWKCFICAQKTVCSVVFIAGSSTCKSKVETHENENGIKCHFMWPNITENKKFIENSVFLWRKTFQLQLWLELKMFYIFASLWTGLIFPMNQFPFQVARRISNYMKTLMEFQWERLTKWIVSVFF